LTSAWKYILCFGFLILISFPVLNNWFNIVEEVASTENRRLKSFPDLDSISIEDYPKELEDYLIDHISIRNQMIRFYNKLNIFVFRSSPVVVSAFIGKGGWFYFSGEELKTFIGQELFTEQQLIDFKKELFHRKEIIETNYKANVFLAIVPNKANIYPEYMPDHLVKSLSGGYGKQAHDYLHTNNFPVIDLFTALTEAKNLGPLYYKTDNHWNDLGGFVAANAILTEFKKVTPTVNNLRLEDYPIKPVKEKAGDIAKMLSIEDEVADSNYIPSRPGGFFSYQKDLKKYGSPKEFPYPWEYEHTRYRDHDSLPTVLIIRDSFGSSPFPYLSEQSKKCTIIFDSWHYGLNEEIISGEKPDIVLYLILESQLKNLMEHARR
jgi:alginate O-acetyltransferase complex protein AlgJ